MLIAMMEEEYDPSPSVARRQHDGIKRVEEQIADADGAIGYPWRVRGLLAQLEKRGAIGKPERMAGERFRDEFARAALDPLRALDMGRVPGSSHPTHHSNERALKCVRGALRALGGDASPAGLCAWFVLGCEYSLRDWARREGWNGRPLSPHVASGILIGALGVLRAHFDGERR